jgi:hypothetical protein
MAYGTLHIFAAEDLINLNCHAPRLRSRHCEGRILHASHTRKWGPTTDFQPREGMKILMIHSDILFSRGEFSQINIILCEDIILPSSFSSAKHTRFNVAALCWTLSPHIEESQLIKNANRYY